MQVSPDNTTVHHVRQIIHCTCDGCCCVINDHQQNIRCKSSSEYTTQSVQFISQYLMQTFYISLSYSSAHILSCCCCCYFFASCVLMIYLTVLGHLIFLLNGTSSTLLEDTLSHFIVTFVIFFFLLCSRYCLHLTLDLMFSSFSRASSSTMSREKYQMKQMTKIISTDIDTQDQDDDDDEETTHESQGIQCTRSKRMKGKNVTSPTLTKSLGAFVSFLRVPIEILYSRLFLLLHRTCRRTRECNSLASFHTIDAVSQVHISTTARTTSLLDDNNNNNNNSDKKNKLQTCALVGKRINKSSCKGVASHHFHLQPMHLLSSYKFLIIILAMIFCLEINTSSASMKVTQQGDILLGGIFPIHQKGKGTLYTERCFFLATCATNYFSLTHTQCRFTALFVTSVNCASLSRDHS